MPFLNCLLQRDHCPMFASTPNCPELLASGGDYVKSIVDWAVQRTWFTRWFRNNVSVSEWYDFQMHSSRECTVCLLRFQFGQRWQYTSSVCTGHDCAHNSPEKTKTAKTKSKKTQKTKQNRKPLREPCLTVEMSLNCWWPWWLFLTKVGGPCGLRSS